MKHILSFAVIAAVTLSPICYGAQYVFPAQGQTPETQKADVAACIAWATAQTGYDPAVATAAAATPAPVAAESTATTEKQRGGALKGAAIASGVAAITDNDKSDAAAAGAVVGLVGQRSSNRRAERNAAENQAQQAQAAPAPAATTASAAEFEKANAACLTGKGYTVQ